MVLVTWEMERHRRETGLQVLTAETAFFDQVLSADVSAEIMVRAREAENGEKPVQANADNDVVCF